MKFRLVYNKNARVLNTKRLFLIFAFLALVLLPFGISGIGDTLTDDLTKITKDDVFKELVSNDAGKTEAVFKLQNVMNTEQINRNDIKINFNEVCGKVNSYNLLINSTCEAERVKEEIYDTRGVCYNQTINNTNVTKEKGNLDLKPIIKEICYNETYLKETIYENYTYPCFKEFEKIDATDLRDIKIDADVSMGDCPSGGYGYKIDWIPEITINDGLNEKVLEKQEWAWWIHIINAIHLNETREPISNIYNETKKLDNIWSEQINQNEYVRVKFEKNLTSSNDITIYPRTVNGTPRIEVYEINETNLIAEFSSLNNNQYNKVYLTNLIGSQDTFDLKVLDGIVEFDHIVDPITGGTITYDGDYTIHTFTSNGTFSTDTTLNATVLVVAGGGGGGSSGGAPGGGGGAGGLLYNNTGFSISSGDYSVTVGSGGAGALNHTIHGGNGTNSSFSTMIAIGGGGAGSGDYEVVGVADGFDGGSGGGGGTYLDGAGGAGTAGQGNDGGSGLKINLQRYAGGGGGGASANGVNGVLDKGGDGGDGTACSINGSSVYYAGGGGGGVRGTTIGTGGLGGGGNGAYRTYGGAYIYNATAGANGTGGGGGGNCASFAPDGGSGIVIIRYLTPTPAPTIIANVTSPSTVYTNTDFKLNLTITDPEADTLTGYVQFYINGSSSGAVQSTSPVTNNTNTLIGTLSSSNFYEGSTLIAEYWAGDGTENTTKENTTQVTVQSFVMGGTVKDSSNIVVNNAKVIIINQATNTITGTTDSNSTGGWTYNIGTTGTYIVVSYDPNNSTRDGDADPHIIVS